MILSTLLLAALPAAAELVDFDQNRSQVESSFVKPMFSTAAPKRLSPEGLVSKAAASVPGQAPAPGLAKDIAPAAFCSTERDCVDFVFEPQDTRTEYFPLRSTEWREECHYGPRGERNCWCRAQWTTNARVQIRIEGRKQPNPWERERFRMCLEGNWINYYEIATAFEYDAKFIDRSAVVVAVPRQKIAMRPDADGIALAHFGLDGASGNFKLILDDRWASYYAGETTVLKIALKKKVFLGSRTVLEKELRLPPTAAYVVNFADYAGEFKLEDGGKYFVDWSFQRPGKVSTDKVIDKDDSSVIEYHKASASAAR